MSDKNQEHVINGEKDLLSQKLLMLAEQQTEKIV